VISFPLLVWNGEAFSCWFKDCGLDGEGKVEINLVGRSAVCSVVCGKAEIALSGFLKSGGEGSLASVEGDSNSSWLCRVVSEVVVLDVSVIL